MLEALFGFIRRTVHTLSYYGNIMISSSHLSGDQAQIDFFRSTLSLRSYDLKEFCPLESLFSNPWPSRSIHP